MPLNHQEIPLFVFFYTNLATLATWCKKLTPQKRPWYWERLRAKRRRGWQRMSWLDGIIDLMTWVWINSRSWWWTGRPGMLQSMRSQRVGHNWATEQQIQMEAFRHIFYSLPFSLKYLRCVFLHQYIHQLLHPLKLLPRPLCEDAPWILCCGYWNRFQAFVLTDTLQGAALHRENFSSLVSPSVG